MAGNPYLGADKEMLAEVLREAESYLSSQLQSGLAADQRAISFVSVIAAAAAIIATAGFGLLMATVPSPLGYPPLVVAFGFLLAMALASYSARPVDFYYCGNTPSSWLDDIRQRTSFEEAIAEQLLHYDEQIKHNVDVLKNNGHFMRAALIVSWLSLVIGGIHAAILLMHYEQYIIS